jgi:hypothetical protein
VGSATCERASYPTDQTIEPGGRAPRAARPTGWPRSASSCPGFRRRHRGLEQDASVDGQPAPGYDLTLSPVKSVSALWAVADPATAAAADGASPTSSPAGHTPAGATADGQGPPGRRRQLHRRTAADRHRHRGRCGRHGDTGAFSVAEAWSTLLGVAGYLALVAALTVGVGAALRSTVVTLRVMLLLLVACRPAGVLHRGLDPHRPGSTCPAPAGEAVRTGTSDTYPTGLGALVLAVWAACALLIGYAVFWFRDA